MSFSSLVLYLGLWVVLAVVVGVGTVFRSAGLKENFMQIIPITVAGMVYTASIDLNWELDWEILIYSMHAYQGIGTSILVLFLTTDENARSFQVKKFRAFKSALEVSAKKRYYKQEISIFKSFGFGFKQFFFKEQQRILHHGWEFLDEEQQGQINL